MDSSYWVLVIWFIIGFSWSSLWWKVRKLSALMDLSHEMHKESVKAGDHNCRRVNELEERVRNLMISHSELFSIVKVALKAVNRRIEVVMDDREKEMD